MMIKVVINGFGRIGRPAFREMTRSSQLEVVAAKDIGLVIPDLQGKLDGSSQRVPVYSGSVVELFTLLEKEASVDTLNAAMKESANESFGYTEDPIVSSDVIGIRFGSWFDATQTKVVTVDSRKILTIPAGHCFMGVAE